MKICHEWGVFCSSCAWLLLLCALITSCPHLQELWGERECRQHLDHNQIFLTPLCCLLLHLQAGRAGLKPTVHPGHSRAGRFGVCWPCSSSGSPQAVLALAELTFSDGFLIFVQLQTPPEGVAGTAGSQPGCSSAERF